ncbi:hypothetical protein MPER_06503, partial [Moniliophthora perniciosa FA553]
MADRPPRPSTDQESAPLLQDPDAEEYNSERDENLSFADRINAVAQEPLTPLTKVLLILVLIFLVLASVFIGLFAGVQHKLDVERGKHDEPHSPSTVTRTATTTHTGTSTMITTTTSTSISTTTAAPPSPTGKPEDPVCLDPDCIILSASILSSLDTSQDPCENFYDYVNGGWLKAHPLPADKDSFGNFEKLALENGVVIREILEGSDNGTSHYDKQILEKLRGLYKSCLNEEQLDDIGQEPLLDFLHTLKDLYRGEGTEVSSAKEEKNKTGLTKALAFLHSRGMSLTLDSFTPLKYLVVVLGIGGLFSFDIEGDVGVDPNHMILWFSQPSLGLPAKEYYQDDDVRKVYQDVVEKLLLAVTGDEEDYEAKPVSKSSKSMVVQTDSTWPPWPWPPWGGDDD